MFIPNTKCKVSRMMGADLFGKRVYSEFESAMCGVVRLEASSDRTSVRTDSSGSRASARDDQIAARLLFPRTADLENGDRIEVLGFMLTVQSVRPQIHVVGGTEHLQVDCEIWKG